ncbi:MAG: valine--tRNA ligase [Candidatus Neomarinimicrobiota bacterium]|nr:valine--tRNA ligase [Candidatus Neomarinimicrobiota bacterium]
MSTPQLDTKYNWDQLEDKWYSYWLDKKYFHADENSPKESFTIVIPPPNVTGKLTMGHVLNNTIQDILIRKARMEGKNACWVPGTDHASIATESKVVAMLSDKGIEKSNLSREEFLEYAWEWKEKYGGIIIKQLKTLGCSCDWDRERFTMDEDYTKAIMHAFVELYNNNLIYKGKRLVNWCPVSKSAISDEEVIHQEKNGKLWYLRYPISNEEEFLIVATTRPETMLGDTAVAVNPNDKRYSHLVGKKVLLPLADREIPIIFDEFVNIDFGTGCVKVTPAHDPNDFEMAERHELPFINIMNNDATLNHRVPKQFQKLSRENARKAIVKEMDEKGLLDKVEDYTNNVGFSERGSVPIEYYLSDQWYMKMESLAKPALDVVKSGKIKFHPEHWVKTYNHWMENIKDWCISRQLIWGHQIPVWYHKENPDTIHVSIDGPKDPENWDRDDDVLDTWASSWLWSFAVHDWPNKDQNLKAFYPTDVLVTGPDIIFFWVARMIMAGIEFKDEIPFKDVYFTSILRDKDGKKFSKSLGNSPDPFTLFKEYGTDAVRFSTMLMSPQGLDVLFSNDRLEIGRNFMNKLWNASRFVHMNLDDRELNTDKIDINQLEAPEKWILNKLEETALEVNKCLDSFRFNEAAKLIYEFTWNDYCDWYIEVAKTRFYGKDKIKNEVAQKVAVKSLKGILTLLHPYAPFITEEIWSYFRNSGDRDLIVSPWISPQAFRPDKDALHSFDIIKSTVSAIRMIRSKMNVPTNKRSDIIIRKGKEFESIIRDYRDIIKSLASVDNITFSNDKKKPEKSATVITHQMEIFVPLEGLIDFEIEISRLSKRLNELDKHVISIKQKLSNKNFVDRAPKEIVSHEKQKLDDMLVEYNLVKQNLDILI